MPYSLAALRVAAAITAAPPVPLSSLGLSEETREDVYAELLAQELIIKDDRLAGLPDIQPTREGRARLRAMGKDHSLAYVQHALLELVKELDDTGAIDQQRLDEIVAPLEDMSAKAAARELEQLVKDGLVDGVALSGDLVCPVLTGAGHRALNAELWPLGGQPQSVWQSTHVAQQINAGAGSHIAASQGERSSATLNHTEGIPADAFAQILGELQRLAADATLSNEDRVLLEDQVEILQETEEGMRAKPGRLGRFLQGLAGKRRGRGSG